MYEGNIALALARARQVVRPGLCGQHLGLGSARQALVSTAVEIGLSRGDFGKTLMWFFGQICSGIGPEGSLHGS